MNIKDYYVSEGEQPLDKIVTDGGFCGILRSIACIGDSLSSGEFESKDETGTKKYHDMYDYSWGQYIARMAGIKVYNFSSGGMSAKQYVEEAAPKRGYFDPEKACPAYIIALGVNDVTHTLASKIKFGEIEDVDPVNIDGCKDSFLGNYARIIHKYKEISPDAKFFLVTTPHDFRSDDIEALYDKLQESLYKMAELFSNTYVIDLRGYAPAHDGEFRKHFYLGGHLNAAGYLLTAKQISSYIDYIIRKNPDDFRLVPFIGTPYINVDYNN